MKALSIQQPWAWLIVNGFKDVENRTWATAFRGRFLVHAGKAWGKQQKEDRLNVMVHTGIDIPMDLPSGGIVGSVELRYCVQDSSSPWFSGPFGFMLYDPKSMPLRALRGQLGFFEVEYPE